MQNINLYVVRRAPRRGLFSRPGLLLMVAIAASAGTTWHLLEARRIDAMRAELKRLDTDRDRLQRQLAQVPSAGAALASEIEAEERAVAALEGIVRRLGHGPLARTQGFTEPLRALARAAADGVWLAGVQLDNTSGALTLDGRAVDAARVPAYLAALRADRAFAGTAFAAIDARTVADDARPRLEFTLRSVAQAATGAAEAPAGAHDPLRVAVPVAAVVGTSGSPR